VYSYGTFGRLGHVTGDVATVQFECREFVRIQADNILQLTVTVKDDQGQPIDNHGLPIAVVLEIH